MKKSPSYEEMRLQSLQALKSAQQNWHHRNVTESYSSQTLHAIKSQQ
jgi:hypothetical protein